MNRSQSSRASRASSSMLWAAWADALGWISELTSGSNLQRRTKGRPLTEPYEWTRNIGGRLGPRVDLPAGCYSDDTQLRLATARAISGHGFDVEAFARVELPVWQSYALGAGRASKAAASGMSRSSANWAANFYPGWENAGGNGAAMRVQPHVYSEPNPKSFAHIDDVIRNTIVTHGHPRAIVGAVLHAVVLTLALDDGEVPGPSSWSMILTICHESIAVFERQPELAAYWRPRWEAVTHRDFGAAWREAVDEVGVALRDTEQTLARMRESRHDRSQAADAYEQIVRILALDAPDSRGSAITTSVAAVLLASAFPDHPAKSAQLAASRLDTDTDTIATMAAAIVGAASPAPLPSPVQDHEYIEQESNRLTSIAEGKAAPQFSYPDLLHWTPPKSGLDSVGLIDGRLALAGMGWLEPHEQKEYEAKDGVWQWMRTSFGPTMLLKRRPVLRELPPGSNPTERSSFSIRRDRPVTEVTPKLFEDLDTPRPTSPSGAINVEQILAWLKRGDYQDDQIGYAVRRTIELGTRQQLEELLTALRRSFRK